MVGKAERMLEIRNDTPFSVALAPGLDKWCNDYAVVVIKGSFDIAPDQSALILANEQLPVLFADQFNGKPGASSILYESDCALLKPATDVVVLGHARALDATPVTALNVNIRVGNIAITRRVFGDRFWEKTHFGWGISPPQRFTQMPLTYENAYGGFDASQHTDTVFLASNPVGKGFIDKKSKLTEGLALPNIENPASLIGDWLDQPAPTGFGFVAPGWQPRCHYSGTCDSAWSKTRAPLLPEDFDDRFFNAAPPDLIHSPKLGNGEYVHIDNVSENGPISFQLPHERVQVIMSQAGNKISNYATLDTVIIEPDEQRVQLVWRATIPAQRKFLSIDWLAVKGNF